MPVRRVLMSTDAVGGVWTYCMELAGGLAAAGITIRLAVLGPAPSPAQVREARAIPGLELVHGDFPLEWMPDALPAQDAAGDWLRTQADAFAPDLVHLNHYGHGHLDWPAPVLVAAHSCVCSWYAAVHGRVPDECAPYSRHVARGLAGAALVVAPSRAMLTAVQRHYGPPRQACVIHNGRDGARFRPGTKQPLVLAAGRMWDEAKNLSMLARHAGRARWPVQVAGELRHPEGGLADCAGLQALGALDAPGMAAALAAAAVFVHPARYEPFGLAVLEAALSGCALVLGDIDSLRELWEGAALFVPPDEGEALVAALDRLADNAPLRQRLALRAREHAQRYSAQRFTRAWLDCHARLARQETVACAS